MSIQLENNDYYDYDSISAIGSLHAITSWASVDPVKIQSRPIGFNANLDAKPIYRVLANSKKI